MRSEQPHPLKSAGQAAGTRGRSPIAELHRAAAGNQLLFPVRVFRIASPSVRAAAIACGDG